MEVTVDRAAKMMDVTNRRIQELVRAGYLQEVGRVGRSILIDGNSLHRQLVMRESGAGRSWAANTAWAAIDLLTKGRTDRIATSSASRLRHRIAAVNARQLSALTQLRNALRRYTVGMSAVRRIAPQAELTGLSIAGTEAGARQFGLTSWSREGEVYVPRELMSDFDARFQAAGDSSRQEEVTVRFVDELPTVSDFLIALDMMDAPDERVRSAGEDAVSDRLHAWRRAA